MAYPCRILAVLGVLAKPLALLALLGGIAAQEAPPEVACRFCGSDGHKPCTKHNKKALELEVGAEHCSVAVECSRCSGTLTIDCKICTNPASDKAAGQRGSAAAKWLSARRAAVDQHISGKETLHARSAHVDLAFSIRPLTVGRKKLGTHELMHRYLDRIEGLRTRFMEVFELTDKDFSARLQIYMFDNCVDHQLLAPRVAGGGGRAQSMKLMGVEAIYCMCHERRAMRGDEEIHRNVVHNVTHLLISNMLPEVWLGNRKHGWIDAGVAHWFEEQLTGKCTNFCYEEVGISGGFKGGMWRAPVRKYAETGQLVPFTTVAKLNTDQLLGQHHAQVFAYVDFLIATRGGKAFAAFVRLAKKGKSTRDALRKTLGLSMLGFDEEFVAWVKETYPLR